MLTGGGDAAEVDRRDGVVVLGGILLAHRRHDVRHDIQVVLLVGFGVPGALEGPEGFSEQRHMPGCAGPGFPVIQPVFHGLGFGGRRDISAQLQVGEFLLADRPYTQVKVFSVKAELADDVLGGGDSVVGVQPVVVAAAVVGDAVRGIRNGCFLDQVNHVLPCPVPFRRVHVQRFQHVPVNVHSRGEELHRHRIAAPGHECADTGTLDGGGDLLCFRIGIPVGGDIPQQHVAQREVAVRVHDDVRFDSAARVAHQGQQGVIIGGYILVLHRHLDIRVDFHKAVCQGFDRLILVKVEIGQFDFILGHIGGLMVCDSVDDNLFRLSGHTFRRREAYASQQQGENHQTCQQFSEHGGSFLSFE